MKTVTPEQANTQIRRANSKGHDVVIILDGEERRYDAGNARLFPKSPEPGTYLMKITSPPSKDGEEGGLSEFLIEIPEPPEEPPAPAPAAPPPSPQPIVGPSYVQIPQAALQDPMQLLMAMREQDRMAQDQERLFFRQQIDALEAKHRSDMERQRAEHRAELERERQTYEYRLSLTERNHARLEDERSEIRTLLEKRLRTEMRLGKQAAGTEWIEKLSENPVLLMAAAKMMGVDISALMPFIAGAGAKDITATATQGGATGLETMLKELAQAAGGQS